MPVQIVECPRDAMQGIKTFIPTEEKASYLNTLLRVGFATLDFGSFVSPKSIPQMKDTDEVLNLLDLSGTETKLLAIIAHLRGAETAVVHQEITYLGYPFSISETFQQRNTNRGQQEAAGDVKRIQELCSRHDKELVLYFSMGFGNPYGDPWSEDAVEGWLRYFIREGVTIFSLSDTVGTAVPQDISRIFRHLLYKYPEITIGAHLHSRPDKQPEKLKAAYEAGCRRFDAAMLGYGGCPMARDELVGNIATETLVSTLVHLGDAPLLDVAAFQKARNHAEELFKKYA